LAWGNKFGNNIWLACCFIPLHFGYQQNSFQAKVVEVDSSCIYGNLEVELDDIRPMDIFWDA
jgi:hypothetical protein